MTLPQRVLDLSYGCLPSGGAGPSAGPVSTGAPAPSTPVCQDEAVVMPWSAGAVDETAALLPSLFHAEPVPGG
jgi:hypothetical protein